MPPKLALELQSWPGNGFRVFVSRHHKGKNTKSKLIAGLWIWRRRPHRENFKCRLNHQKSGIPWEDTDYKNTFAKRHENNFWNPEFAGLYILPHEKSHYRSNRKTDYLLTYHMFPEGRFECRVGQTLNRSAMAWLFKKSLLLCDWA